MVERKLSEIIRFAHDLALFSSFLQDIIQTNLSSTLAVRPRWGRGEEGDSSGPQVPDGHQRLSFQRLLVISNCFCGLRTRHAVSLHVCILHDLEYILNSIFYSKLYHHKTLQLYYL